MDVSTTQLDCATAASRKRSGDSIRLGDRIVVDVTDVAILRRTVYAKRARGKGEGDLFEPGMRPRFKVGKTGDPVRERARNSRDERGKPFPGGGGMGRGKKERKAQQSPDRGPKKGKKGGKKKR